jgi:hypothetical protein
MGMAEFNNSQFNKFFSPGNTKDFASDLGTALPA